MRCHAWVTNEGFDHDIAEFEVSGGFDGDSMIELSEEGCDGVTSGVEASDREEVRSPSPAIRSPPRLDGPSGPPSPPRSPLPVGQGKEKVRSPPRLSSVSKSSVLAPPVRGMCLHLFSGTGCDAKVLSGYFDEVVSVDITENVACEAASNMMTRDSATPPTLVNDVLTWDYERWHQLGKGESR